MFDFIKRRNKKDFASVALDWEVKGISIPVLPLEMYPEIAKRALSLIEQLSTKIAEETGETADEILEALTPISLIHYIPKVITVAADEFFSFAAFVLDIDEQVVRKMSLADLIRISLKVYEINEFAEVQKEIGNFIKALRKGRS